MTRILIAGCGYVGEALAARLLEAGHAPIGLRRTASPSAPAGLLQIEADLARPETLDALPPGVEQVVYAASAGGFSAADYEAAYVAGPTHLIDALRAQGQPVQRAIFVSSTSVYPQSDGEVVDEDAPTSSDPASFSAATILAGERLVLAGPWTGVAVRFGGIYGPGRTRLIDEVRTGAAFLTEGPPVWTNRVHRDDCAAILQHLLDLPRVDPVYNGVDAEPAPRDEVLRWLAAQLGVDEITRRGRESLPARTLRSNKRVSSARLQASGYRFLHPSFREGYAALLRSGA